MFSRALISLILLLQLSTAQALTVISDLDDTIKITRVSHPESVTNGLFSTKTFLGMPELMRVLRAPVGNSLQIVSGSPDLIRSLVDRLLVRNNIEADGVYLVTGSSRKPEVLEKLVSQAQDEVILLGDDQENDPKFYQDLQDAYPDKVKAIYIHQLNEYILPIGQIGYFTAYEVAVHEHEAGRLSAEDVDKVKNNISKDLIFNFFQIKGIKKGASKLLIPEWQKCSPYSVSRVLSTTRQLRSADQNFLNLIEKIALQNCND